MSESYLIITYSYKPLLSPHAFRWATIAEYWSSQGNKVDVISIWKPGLPKEEISKGVNIHRVGGGLIEIIRQNYYNKANNKKKNNNTTLIHNQKSIIKLIHDYTWKKIYWPDYACLWYFSCKKKVLDLFKIEKYNKVISVSIPFTDHLIPLYLKKKYYDFTWIVDMGDPFHFLTETPTNNHKIYNSLNLKVEKKVFKAADAIMVTPEAINKYKEVFPESSRKMHVVPPLLTSEINNFNFLNQHLNFSNKIRLIFVGTLYNRIRNPNFLLKLYDNVLKTKLKRGLELHFIGNINDCEYCFGTYKHLLNKKIFIHGMVKKEEAYKLMKEADVLINIGNNIPYQLPSKVVEYASTGKPIINIVKKETDNAINFFNNYPIKLNIIEEPDKTIDEQSQEIKTFLQTLPKKINVNELKQFIEPFKVNNVAETYSKIN